MLTDEAGLITGIVDFGDMSHTALVTDLASVLDSLAGGRGGGELFRVARLILDGYQRRTALEAVLEGRRRALDIARRSPSRTVPLAAASAGGAR